MGHADADAGHLPWAGIATLVHHQSPELSAYWIGQGAWFVLHGTDRRALTEGFRTEFGQLRAGRVSPAPNRLRH